MPLFTEEGTEVEGAKTAEEVENILEEAKEATKQEVAQEFEDKHKEKEEELITTKEELDTAKEELEKEKGKDKNFKNLREGKEKSDDKIVELTEKVDTLTKSVEEKVGGLEKATQEKELKTRIKGVSGEDKELADKIEFHYNKLTGEEDAEQRFDSAVVLAVGNAQAASVLQGAVISAAGGHSTPTGEESKELSSELKEVAKKSGLSDADIESAKKNIKDL